MKGDKKIIDILNELLAGELTAVDQYLLHGEMYADMGLNVLAEKSIHESDHERQHARALIQRILFLEGKPDMRPDAFEPGETVEEMLQRDLDLEYKVRGHLAKGVALCETHGDYVSRQVLVAQLADTEEDHTWWLEKQLRLIKMVGLQNYQQARMGEEGAPG